MIVLILGVLLLSSALCDCPLNPSPRQTFTGFINAQLNNDPKLHGTPQQYSYPLQQNLQESGVSVAIGVSGLQLNANGLLEFSIEHQPSTIMSALKFRLQVNDTQAGWKSMRFNFLATQSSLFLISSQLVTTFSGEENKDGKYYVYRPILNFNNFQIEPVIRVFLNGIQIKAKPLGTDYSTMVDQYNKFKTFSSNPQLVTFFAQALQEKKTISFRMYGLKLLGKMFSLNIETNAELKGIRISSVVFSKKILSIKHSYVLGDFYLLSGNQYKFSSLQSMNMVMTGVLGFKIPRDQRYTFSLVLDSYFGQSYFNTTTNFNYLALDFTFIAFEMQQKYVCEDCPNSPSIFQKFCVEICPRTYSRTLRSDNYFCEKCEMEKLKIVDSSSGECVCAKRHYLDSAQDTCKPCSYDCMTCSQADRCLTCDNNLLQTKRKLNSAGRCECPLTDYYDDRSSEDIVCQKCDPKCLTCNGPRSHDCLSCVPSKELDPLGFCVCRNGFFEDEAGNCACNFPKMLMGDFCLDTTKACNENQTEQFIQISRRCICKPDFIQVADNCIKCGNNSKFSKEELRCKCTNKTVYTNGECLPCQNNQVYDEIAQICICRPGTFKSIEGACVACPLKMTYINGQCECIFNYFESRPGVCERCLRETDGPKCRKNTF